jgi:tetratricopeptide (TPR) repeat protein
VCLERAVKDEPECSLGWSRLAFIYIESKKRSIDTPPDWARLARDAANNALNADRDNPDAYYALAILSRMLGEDLTVYQNLAQRAIDLNPNDAWILADLGTFMAYAGEWEKGKEWVTRARALNPRLHRGFDNVWHLHAFAKGDYEEARNIRLNIGARTYMSMASLTASYAMNGEQQKAEEMLARIREQFPDSLKDPRAPFRARGMPKDLIEGLMSGLRKAGLDVSVEAP